MRKMILTTTALVSLTIGAAHANVLADTVVQDLQNLGYTNIEVYVGPTQIKAEGYQPGLKIEVIRDLTTGAVLKQEIETLSPEDLDDDYTAGIEIEDVPFDFLDSDANDIVPDDEDDVSDIDEDDSTDDDDDDDTPSGNDDEAFNDPLANRVSSELQARGYTSVETLVGLTQIRSEGYNAAGAKIEVIYDRTTGVLIRETTETGSPDDDDYLPGVRIEDVPFDFLDAEGNALMPEDEDEIDDIDEIDEIDDIDDDIDDDNEGEDGDGKGDDGESDGGDGGESGGGDGGESDGGDGGEGDGGDGGEGDGGGDD